MKKLILFLILGLFIAIYLIFQYSNPNTSTNQAKDSTVWESRDLLFLKGSEEDIRKYMESKNSNLHYGDLWSLIDRNRNDLLEILLLEYQVDPDMGAKNKANTALLYASEKLKPESVNVLLKYGADVNYKNKNGKTALILAAMSTENMTREGLTPLGNTTALEITKILIEAGADINLIGNFSETAIGGAILDDDFDRVDYLVSHGGNVNFQDRDGANYLFYCDDVECVAYFLSKGLELNSVANDGENILQSFLKTSLINLELVEYVVEKGVNICNRDNAGLSVLDHAEYRGLDIRKIDLNPEYYVEKLNENKSSEIYIYLENKYNEKCLP